SAHGGTGLGPGLAQGIVGARAATDLGGATSRRRRKSRSFSAMSSSGPRILIVEDDPAIRRLLRITVNGNHYAVLEAGGVAAALAVAETARPDLIILDLGLPDGDGLDVVRQLRVHDRMPILILSVKNLEADKIAALEAGADDYVTKPFDVEEL